MRFTRREFLYLSGAAAGALAAGAGVGAEAGGRRVRTTLHQVTWPVRRPVRIVHLTDLHLGWGAKLSLVRRVVDYCRSIRPHLTVLTGDYINHLHHLEELRRVVARLPRPCLVTLGNHDHKAGAARIRAVFAAAKIPVLSNEARLLTLGRGRTLWVVGIDDSVTRHHDVGKAMAKVPATARALVLTHAPSLADQVARHGSGRHLVLAGHTHAGQIYIPLLTPAIARLKGVRYLAGWYTVGKTRLYVNAGIGDASIRKRVGRRGRPEIAVIDLRPGRGSGGRRPGTTP
jgi:predicted MPP superfamily phosphohydrolase